MFEFYPTERQFRVMHEDTTTDWKRISAGIPQRSVLGPISYLLYITDIPSNNYSMTAMFAFDTAIMTTDEDHQTATGWLQSTSFQTGQ
ncbi:Hypothetical protein CINCED_3A018816 [Cinara cedri]|uniref:Reverse transcriptase domain n=1 Tax=Cinara cedri TaxID=506608 RepID=A0A5E4M802_9HEMI|nr:Hypothetical protein CINCED_3A018816 [Cinara cedri]